MCSSRVGFHRKELLADWHSEWPSLQMFSQILHSRTILSKFVIGGHPAEKEYRSMACEDLFKAWDIISASLTILRQSLFDVFEEFWIFVPVDKRIVLSIVRDIICKD